MNNTRLCTRYCAWIILVGSWIYVYLLSVSLAHSHIQSILPFYSSEGYNNDIGCSFKIHLQDRIKAVAAVISNMLSKVWVVIYIYEVINAACSEYIDDSVWHFKKSRHLLVVFTTLRKETVGFVISARVCVEQLCSHLMDFHEIWELFENMLRSIWFHVPT